MLISLGRHRNDLPPDQLDPLVFEQDAGGRHPLEFGHGETPPWHAFGRSRRLRPLIDVRRILFMATVRQIEG